MKKYVVASITAALLCASAHAQFITPGSNLVIDGIPPISDELVAKVQAYTEFKPSGIVAWHPAKPGMLIRKRATNSNQLHYLASPGAVPEQITDFPDAVNGATFQPKKGEYILFNKASGGDEVFRIYRMDLASKTVTPISDEKERAASPTWNRKGDRIVYATVGVDRNNKERKAVTKLYLADPMKPEDTKLLASFDGGGWEGFRFSRDDKHLVFQEYVSANEAHLWTLDIASGAKKRVTPNTVAGAPVYYGDGRFTRDGKGLYAVSDRDSEFRRLIVLDLASGKETVLTGHLKFDVDAFSVSEKAKRIALITNEEGSGALRLLELPSFKELPRPALLPGEISALRWSGADEDEDSDGRELAVNIASAHSPGDVYSISTAGNKLTRWTSSSSAALNPLDFVDPQLVKWKSFDGLMISGFLYQPDAKKFPAGKIVGALASLVDGSGGGRPTMAEAGGKNPARLPEAMGKLAEIVGRMR